jgi:hypothetical protein
MPIDGDPTVFGREKITKIFINSDNPVYEIPGAQLANLVITSNTLLNDLFINLNQANIFYKKKK